MGRLAGNIGTKLRTLLSFPRFASDKQQASSLFFLFIVLTLFCSNIYPSLLTGFDHAALEEKYMNHIADPDNFQWFLSDNDLYAYAGWRYVTGASPDDINLEHPPLAKYLIGISEVLFNNPNVIGAAFGVLSLIILYELSKRLLGHSLFALVPVYMLSLERIFIGISSASMLDIYLVLFLLLSIYCFSGGDSDAKLLAGAIALGLASACKLIAVLAVPSLILPVITRRRRKAWKFIVQVMLAAALVYCLCYARFFMDGRSVEDFLEMQCRMVSMQYGMRCGRSYAPGRLVLTLLTGIIGPETRNLIYVDEAAKEIITIVTRHGLSIATEFNLLTWPVCFSAAVLSTFHAIKRRNTELLQSCAYFFSFLVPLSFAQSFVWYLLPVLPIGFLLLTTNLKKIVKESNGRLSSILMFIYMGALLLWLRFLILPSFIEL